MRIAFNGSLINTHAGQSPYSPWGNGEKLTSLNCPMNSFVQFNHTDGKRYQLAYKPGTGEVDIDRINAGGAGVTGVWGGTWTKGWTHLTPFTVGGKPHYFAYKSATGEVDFDRVNPGGLGDDHDRRGHVVEGLDELHALHARRPAVLHRLQPPLRRSEPRPHQRGRQRRLDAVVGQLGQGLDAPDAVQARRHAVLRRLQGQHRRRRDRQDHGRRQQRRDHRGVGRQLGHRLVAPGADDAQRRRAHAALQVHHRPGLVREDQGRRPRHPDAGQRELDQELDDVLAVQLRRHGPLPRVQDRHRQGRRRQAQRGRHRDRPRSGRAGGRLGWA